MPKLLISVRDVEEARQICDLDIDILDVKEPNNGPLGAPSLSVLEQIAAERCSENTVKSIAMGELSDAVQLGKTVGETIPISVLNAFQFAKIALADCGRGGIVKSWQENWTNFFADLPPHIAPVAVAYLDNETCNAPEPLEVIEFAASQPCCKTVLLDTHSKKRSWSTVQLPNEIRELLNQAKRYSLETVLAGSVNHLNVSDAVFLEPDYIGARGVVCTGDRNGRVDRNLTKQFLQKVKPHRVQV